MAFPSSPTHGQVYVKDGTSNYVYSSASNSWTLTADSNLTAGNIKSGVTILGVAGTLNPELSDIYIASGNPAISFGSTSGGSGGAMGSTYSINSGNIIYSFGSVYMAGFKMFVEYFTLDSSSFPVRAYQSLPYSISPNYSLLSQYLDSGIVYFNGWYSSSGVYHYDTYNLSTHAWTTNNSGSHTSGTLINSALQLNGFQYDPTMVTDTSNGLLLADIQTKVTKL